MSRIVGFFGILCYIIIAKR